MSRQITQFATKNNLFLNSRKKEKNLKKNPYNSFDAKYNSGFSIVLRY